MPFDPQTEPKIFPGHLDQLPDSLHELLEVALLDLRFVEETPGFDVDMSWYLRQRGDTCTVCVGGAVVAVGLGKRRLDAVDRSDFSKVKALDSLRTGNVLRAARCLYLVDDEYQYLDRSVVDYRKNRDAWWTKMYALLEDLRGAGI